MRGNTVYALLMICDCNKYLIMLLCMPLMLFKVSIYALNLIVYRHLSIYGNLC